MKKQSKQFRIPTADEELAEIEKCRREIGLPTLESLYLKSRLDVIPRKFLNVLKKKHSVPKVKAINKEEKVKFFEETSQHKEKNKKNLAL